MKVRMFQLAATVSIALLTSAALAQRVDVNAGPANVQAGNGTGLKVDAAPGGPTVNVQPGAGLRIDIPQAGVNVDVPTATPRASGIEPANSNRDLREESRGPIGSAIRGATGAALGMNDPNRWRYKYHNNVWWYYTPENRWMTYRNNTWSYYGPSAQASAGVPTRPYSSGYRGLYTPPPTWLPNRGTQENMDRGIGTTQSRGVDARAGGTTLNPDPASGVLPRTPEGVQVQRGNTPQPLTPAPAPLSAPNNAGQGAGTGAGVGTGPVAPGGPQGPNAGAGTGSSAPSGTGTSGGSR